MLIYLPVVSALLSLVVLALVYHADLYEREPIENIQNWFLLGLLVQLVLILIVDAAIGLDLWAGPWILITVGIAALALPFSLRRESELDERFDGIVYTVACLSGATGVIHVHNLPKIMAASPFGSVLAPDAAPGLRDLLILAGSGSFATDLGQTLTILLIAVLIGATLGVLQLGGRGTATIAAACLAVGLAAAGLDLVSGGSWWVRAGLAVAACTAAVLIKRRSVFRGRPQTTESEVLVQAVKTALMVLGATLLAAAVLMAAAPSPGLPTELPINNLPDTAEHSR